MASVAEVVVEAVPSGISETTGELEGMEQSVKDSTEAMDEQAGRMSDLTESFQGAMSVAVAGLAVGAAGLLSQIPVIGEAFSGLGAIIDAITFQMDKVLRPILSPLGQLFFGLSTMIFEAEGAFGAIIGVVSTVLSVGALLVGVIGGAIAGFLALGGSLSTLVTIGATVLGAIGLIITAIASLPATLIAAIAGVIAFAIALVTNFMGARDKLTSIVGTIVNFVVDGFKWLVENGLSFLSDLVNRGVGFFNTLADNLATWAEDVASDAVDWGKGIIDGLVSGLKNAITSGGSKIKELLGLDDISTSGVSSSAFNFDSISTGNLDTSVSDTNDFIGARGSGDTTFILDGREINDRQGRYRKDALNRRG